MGRRKSPQWLLLSMSQVLTGLRRDAGMTQQCLATASRVTRANIALIESARILPSYEALLMLADPLGVPAWKIFRMATAEECRG